MFDGKAFGAEIVSVVKSYLEQQLSPVIARMDAMEQRLADMPVPKDGQDADPQIVASMVAGEIRADLAKMRATLDAIQPAPELPDVAGMIEQAVAAIPAPLGEESVKAMIAESIAAIPAPEPVEPPTLDPSDEQIRAWAGRVAEVINLPVPKDGKSVTLDDVRPMMEELVATAVAAIPAPKGITVDDVRPLIEETLAAWPKPQDGKSVTADDVRPMMEEMVSKAVAAIPVPKDGKDGVGMAGGIIDRDGHLNFTMTDGTLRDLGKVCGKDGEPGKPGADGFGYEDFTEELAEDGRTIIKRYIKGERVKEFRHTFSVVLYQGVWKEGTEYQTGDSVTFNGSQFIAQCPTTAKPETSKDWQLSVKRGRDGKDGVMKAEKPTGPISVGVPSKKEDC